jgi:hypothetical protein
VILFLTLFPFGWLGTLSPAIDELLTVYFPEPWGHFYGHFILFFIVGFAALVVFPSLRSRFWLYLPLILLVAAGQEFFQLLYKQRLVRLDEAMDLIPDYLGSATTFALLKIALTIQARRRASLAPVEQTAAVPKTSTQ